ncbi:MAG TPA: 2-oxoacid:ferredoxin oxidoreductase subunit beta [Kineosporiaceae bacterium]|nr:2-oxoacid:ferredoxin oxidoreductase subunit beta [Kineosporiaceae bacterium]
MTEQNAVASSNGAGRVSRPVDAEVAEGSRTRASVLTAKDLKTDQEVRWCPGCGDYAILAAVQSFLPELGIPREKYAFISGIGCSSRFPYYLNTYGMHSIHGRAPGIATGLAVSRPDLSVWVVTGDGDALSIGGNHLIHALRRNVNLKILLFNNRIYGLTKGQFSPTSEFGKVTKTSPLGSIDYPFNPLSLAIGAGATFAARTLASDRAHLTSVLRAAAAHQGAAFIEIYQNCEIFNDRAFDLLTKPESRGEWTVELTAGQPLRFGPGGTSAVVHDPDGFGLATKKNVADDDPGVIIHDPTRPDPSYAFALSRLGDDDPRLTPIGVLRDVELPTYEELMTHQVAGAEEAAKADLAKLFAGNDSWVVAPGGTHPRD